MGSQRLRPLPWGMTARAWWVLPQGMLTDAPSAAEVAPWRPWLEISWREGRTLALVLMNPSAANTMQLDAATGRAEVQLEQDGERVTLGEGLPLVSEHCDRFIREAVEAANLVVCGWGAKVGPERTAELLAGPLKGVELHAWRLGASGFPKHPRGQPKDLDPLPWRDGRLHAWDDLAALVEAGVVPHLYLRDEAERPLVAQRRAVLRDGFEAASQGMRPRARRQLRASMWRWA